MRCARGTTDCTVAHEHNAAWLCEGDGDNPYVGWLTPGDLEPGDCLGYVDHEGQFSPGVTVVAVAPVPDTGMWNITTHAGSLVLQNSANVFVFSGAAR